MQILQDSNRGARLVGTVALGNRDDLASLLQRRCGSA